MDMDSSFPILSLSTAAVAGAAAVFPKLQSRLALSRAKHRSLTGHSKMSKMVARLVPHYEFDINDFFRSDGAPTEIANRLSMPVITVRKRLEVAILHLRRHLNPADTQRRIAKRS